MHRAMATLVGACCLVALLILAVSTPPALAQEVLLDPGAGAEVKLLPTVAGTSPTTAKPTIQVLREDEEELDLEFELPALLQSDLKANGVAYDMLAIEDGGFEGADGSPMIPTFTRLIQIPDRQGVRITVTGVDKSEIPGFRLAPMQPDEPGAFTADPQAYLASGYPATATVSAGEPAVMRDLRVVPLTFRPVRYDAAAGKVELASRIRVHVTFAGEDLRNVQETHPAVIARSFDQLYRSLVVNYDGPRDGQRVGNGKYVIVCPNNSTVITKLAPLVNWRTRRGFEVYVATTAETGTTASQIQTWLRNAYNTWPNPPEYITMVGDPNSYASVYVATGSGSGQETDFVYAMLSGSDILPEAHVGRISAWDTDDLDVYVAKMVGYESAPYMTDTSWFTRGCVVGDPEDSGYTCVQIAQWCDLRLRGNGYTQVDAIYQSPWVTQMLTALNRGDTIFMYRGYWGMSGFDPSDVFAVNNPNKPNFSSQITCGTGSYYQDDPSITEAWIRSGSVATPKGGIGAIGAAGLGTHTRYNNCATYGIWGGVLNEKIYHMGAALTRGKLELYLNYYAGDSGAAWNFTYWINLMGDAAGEVWTGVPQTINVSHPASLALGANAVTVTVTKSTGLPLAGADVCLYLSGQTQVVGQTDAAGTVELPVDVTTAGSLLVTVTKHNYYPYQGSISFAQETRFVGYNAHTIDDDGSGGSSGNDDGVVNPNETLEIAVQAKNFGTLAISGITGTLSCADPYVTISDASESFPNLASNATGWSLEDFDLTISGAAPNGHIVLCDLDVTSSSYTWRSVIEIPVVAAEFAYDAVTLSGVGTTFDPGETGEISVRIRNNGGATGLAPSAQLVSHSPWVTVNDAQGTYGNIAIGATGENTGDRFGLSAAAGAYPGHLAALSLYLEFSSGARDTVDFGFTVGVRTTTSPTGPDNYGYYAFDNTDTGYPEAPTYSWVEIDPRYGGSGTDVGLTDEGDEQGDSQQLTLPFSFKYYDKNFGGITVCSDGWIAMGGTTLSNYNNWTIPCAGAPPNLIAPAWSALHQSGENQVYYWSDTAQHRYIVQWSRMINDDSGANENFEVILYDPAYYPTATGDGIIVFQYQDFDIGGSLHMYWTTGIQNADCNDGVLYSYFNMYNAGAATIPTGGGRAIKFMPVEITPMGTLSGYVRNASSGGAGIFHADVQVLGRETFSTAVNGSYSGSIEAGMYTVIASHPSFAADTALAVEIIEDETTTLNFSLVDVVAPEFSTTPHSNTSDSVGPYVISTQITEYSAFEELALTYNAAGAGWVTVPLSNLGDDIYSAEIPGQAYGSMIKYYLHARDTGGNAASDPAGAPAETYSFWVVAPIFEDGMEAGAGEWSHYIVTATYRDQWHQSTARNHTAGGSWSWKFGDTGTGVYLNMCDGALQTEAFNLDGGETALKFWHWMQGETSTSYPTQCYDGGLLEISVNGGAWTQMTPVSGGYNYTIRTGAGPGPFPAGTPVWSGSYDWMQSEFDLTGISGSVRLRFRFGSDGSVGLEGWYVDDIEVLPTNPGASETPVLEPSPTHLALYQNAPNPFGRATASTTIGFDLPQPAPVRLAILDVSGRLIETLVDETLPAGRHHVGWGGEDTQGHRVDNGVYFYILKAGDAQLSRRMLILR